MVCDMVVIDEQKLLSQGWTPEEIAEVQGDVRRARADAREAAMRAGYTRLQGAELEDQRDARARKVAHDRHHAKLEAALLAGELPEVLKLHIMAEKVRKG